MKRLVALLLSMVLLATLVPQISMADGERQSGAFTYKLKGNGTAIITGYDWKSMEGQDIFIPRMLDGYTVTEIGEKAFGHYATDENGIPDDAYYSYCAKSLVIPDTVTTIGPKAFMGLLFETFSITIPASVQYIGPGAFSINGIGQFVVEPSNPVYATIDGVLYNKQKKELVAYPLSKAKQSVSISGNDIGRITIPDGIVSIGDYAFWGIPANQIVIIPPSLRRIGNYAFAYSGIRHIGYGAPYKINDCEIKPFSYEDSIEELGEGAFYKAFTKNENRPSIHLWGTSITEIPKLAFYGCYISTEINLGQHVTIGEKAFAELSVGERYSKGEVTTITMPASLKTIETSAFSNITSANQLVFSWPDSPANATIGEKAFLNSEIRKIDLPNGLAKIEADAFNGTKLTEVVLPQGLKSIGDCAFKNAPLKKLSLPDSLTTIGNDIASKTSVSLQVIPGTYAALWASENGYIIESTHEEDSSWLND